ncbi:MAG: hypothetical protein ACYDER_10605 [Ktedonobacteraceae bacterium]
MDRIKIVIEQEQVDNGALFIQGRINDTDLPGIFNVEAFFAIKESKGLVPLFTCGCGIFGCGGYFVNISCTDTALILQNSYHRFNRSLQAEFEYHLDWQQVSNIAQEIFSYLQKLYERNPQAYVTTGYGGENLLNHLPDFRKSPLLVL